MHAAKGNHTNMWVRVRSNASRQCGQGPDGPCTSRVKEYTKSRAGKGEEGAYAAGQEEKKQTNIAQLKIRQPFVTAACTQRHNRPNGAPRQPTAVLRVMARSQDAIQTKQTT